MILTIAQFIDNPNRCAFPCLVFNVVSSLGFTLAGWCYDEKSAVTIDYPLILAPYADNTSLWSKTILINISIRKNLWILEVSIPDPQLQTSALRHKPFLMMSCSGTTNFVLLSYNAKQFAGIFGSIDCVKLPTMLNI